MSSTKNKYSKNLGELLEYDYKHYDAATWRRVTKRILVIPINLVKRSGWWHYECQVVGEYSFVHMRDGFITVSCREFFNLPSALSFDTDNQATV